MEPTTAAKRSRHNPDMHPEVEAEIARRIKAPAKKWKRVSLQDHLAHVDQLQHSSHKAK